MNDVFFEIEIVKYLKEQCSPFYSKITELYQLSKKLLSEIPKTFPNYTLHDIDHSIRVIQYMNDFIKNKITNYSELHLALIVYVGLIHDIGMIVSDDEELKLYAEFEHKDKSFSKLSYKEKKEYLKEYIRKNHGIRVHDVLDIEINVATHLRSIFYTGETNSYDLSSLIADICQSHTENFDWIVKNLDNDIRVAQYKLNPQQIAILLRLGDVLDIDDRRAPWILYKFLNPNGYSDTEWRKHIPITNYDKIEFKNGEYEIIFSGECTNPKIHRKILEYIDWIDCEIKQINSILLNYDEIYKFKIKTPVNVKIKTLGFIETALRFNLKYEQISKLLMGEKIYGSKQDGLRELLQNSIDAVLLINDIEKRKKYTTFKPTIGIEINKSNNEFVVFDNGVGMSEEILKEYFFNIGNSYYISEEFKKETHQYTPIGHFGVGFLACFMLSSKIQLETKHYLSPNAIKMDFEKESPYVTMFDLDDNDFPHQHGTRIIMEYNQVIPNIFKDEEEVINYVKDLIITDEYQFLFINNNNREEISVERPKNLYEIEDGTIEFDYKLNDILNVKFDLMKFFSNNEYVYFITDNCSYSDSYSEGYYSYEHDYDFVSLAYFEETIIELDRLLQENDGDIKQAINELEDSFPASSFLTTIAITNKKQIRNFYLCHNSIYEYFQNYLNKYLNNDCFEWIEIPIILHTHTFNSFLASIEEKGYNRAFHEYKSDIQFISIISTKTVTDELIFSILDRFLNACSCDLDIDYFDEYPIQPIRRKISLLKSSKAYLQVEENYSLKNIQTCKLHLKGIRVKDKSIVLPYVIANTEISNLYVNIKSSSFDTDISRNNFDNTAKEKLSRYILHLIYEDMIKNNMFSEEEKELVQLFLNKYYN